MQLLICNLLSLSGGIMFVTNGIHKITLKFFSFVYSSTTKADNL